MSLLGSEKYRNELANALREASDEVVVLSAFVTLKGLKWVFENTPIGSVKGSIVVRWKPEDIISGASTLDIYPEARKVGWDVYVYPTLHAKTILIDCSTVFLGSANVTGHGLSISTEGNQELGVRIAPSDQDLKVVYSLLSEATLITDTIYDDLKQIIEEQRISAPQKPALNFWPSEIEELFNVVPKKLWVVDLPWCTPEELINSKESQNGTHLSIVHDMRLLGFEALELVDENALKIAFSKSRAWKWLLKIIRDQEGHEVYFGTVTSMLHDSLVDDPKPYRKNVKGLVHNLFSWAECLGGNLVTVDVPGKKSQRIRYLG